MNKLTFNSVSDLFPKGLSTCVIAPKSVILADALPSPINQKTRVEIQLSLVKPSTVTGIGYDMDNEYSVTNLAEIVDDPFILMIVVTAKGKLNVAFKRLQDMDFRGFLLNAFNEAKNCLPEECHRLLPGKINLGTDQFHGVEDNTYQK